MKIKRLAQYILPHIQKDISWIENKKKEILEGLRLFSENLETLWL